MIGWQPSPLDHCVVPAPDRRFAARKEAEDGGIYLKGKVVGAFEGSTPQESNPPFAHASRGEGGVGG
ncbi:hypothetical protein ANRL4_00161 [Anaerolineae bacterium]|nr:hypothetical protein ANRL4_00161 [Anaerolineae bacterium]